MIILKILLIILLSLLLLILLALALNVHISAEYTDKLSLSIRVLFVKIPLLPSKNEKKKSKGKKEKRQKKVAESEQKKGLREILHEKGLSGFLDIIKELARLLSSVLSHLKSHIIINNFRIYLSYAGGDAAKTAIGYGKCCAVVYPAASFIISNVACRKSEIKVTPDFNDDAKTEISAALNCKVRIFHLLVCALKFIVGYIKLKNNGGL